MERAERLSLLPDRYILSRLNFYRGRIHNSQTMVLDGQNLAYAIFCMLFVHTVWGHFDFNTFNLRDVISYLRSGILCVSVNFW